MAAAARHHHLAVRASVGNASTRLNKPPELTCRGKSGKMAKSWQSQRSAKLKASLPGFRPRRSSACWNVSCTEPAWLWQAVMTFGMQGFPPWPPTRKYSGKSAAAMLIFTPPKLTSWSLIDGDATRRDLSGQSGSRRRPGTIRATSGFGDFHRCHQPPALGNNCGSWNQRREYHAGLSHQRPARGGGERFADGHGFSLLPVALIGSRPFCRLASR